MSKIKPQHFIRLSKSILTLIIIVCIIISIFVAYPYIRSYSKYEVILDTTSHKKSFIKHQIDTRIKKDTVIDLNTANLNDFLSIGLSKRQSYSILNYRKSGGIFRSKEDILKIYTIDKNAYNKVQNNIYCTEIKSKTKSTPEKKIKEYLHVNLNIADTIELKKIDNIGSFRAKKIVEYRTKLGGFYDINQLLEIYSIDSSVIQKIDEFVWIDTNIVSKIDINTTDFKELLKHPYTNYYMTKNILAYRKIQGSIRNIEELRYNNILNAEEFDKVRKYLKTF